MKMRKNIRSLVAASIRGKSKKVVKPKTAKSPSRLVQAMLARMPQAPQAVPQIQEPNIPPAMPRQDVIGRALDMIQRIQAMKSLQGMSQ